MKIKGEGKTMRRISLLVVLAVALTLAVAGPMTAQATLTVSKWTEHASNPVFDPSAKAYYPTIVYDASQFSGHGDTAYYKMWFGSNSGTGYAYSNDGISWTEGVNPVSGLTNANHPHVEYYSDGFAGANSGSNSSSDTMYYRMWYWPGLSYSINDIRYAESNTGTGWYNDQPITQVGSTVIDNSSSSNWNRGSYGVCDVLYNASGSDTLDNSNIWNNKFVMYYDATTGGDESIGLAYSTNGIYWKGYGQVLAGGGAGAWDNDYATFGTVVKDGSFYHLWYSGGDGKSNHGIGYAWSTNGINWTKDSKNPIFHKDDGVSWRNERTYAPMVIVQGSNWKMWFSGTDTATSNYAIGYATASGPFPSIQAAVDAASAGDTINVAAGTYDEAVNIDSFTGLSINGADKTTVTVKPSSTLDWNVGGYGSSRKAVFRVVNSTNVVLQNMTMDFDLVKGNNVFGILYWDSTGTVNNNILKNMSVSDASGGYYEIGSYYRAPWYTDASRANITISANEFIDIGRLGVCTHDYVEATITGNTFYKTIDDFGYAIELGSQSTGTISDNIIYGYDTAALSDGSESAGIYIENCFTGSVSGMTKNVSLTGNEVYDSQWGLVIGNEWDGYAGDVDIVAALSNNNFHDNDLGGVVIADEDKESGSSVTVNGGSNTLTNNGDYGYYIYTQGDGDITVDLSGETITGHDTGVYVEDTGSSSTSSYDVAINDSSISGNTTYGVNNTVSSLTLDAENNWWGDASGPGSVGPGSGDGVSTNVDYSPWLGNYPSTPGSNTYYVDDTSSTAEIQALITGASSGDTIVLAAGTYTPSGGFTISTPGITIMLSDGTIIQASSPCFTVNADNTTIKSDTTFPGGLIGVCEPSSGSNGIETSKAVNNLVIRDIEIRKGSTATGDGIHIGHNVTNLQILNNYIHGLDGDGIEYTSGVTVGGVHEVQGNLFQNNAGFGINNASATSYEVKYNSWDSLTGPIVGGANGVNGTLDYDPWTHVALSMTYSGSPKPDKVGEGYQITYTIKMDAKEVFGADFDLNFDNISLTVKSIITNTNFQQTDQCKVSTPTEANGSGVISFCGSRTTALNDSAQTVFIVVFEGKVAGTVPLNLDETDDAFAMSPPSGGSNNIYASLLDDGSVTVYDSTTVTGRIDLQGRANDTGAVMTFGTSSGVGYGPFTFSTSTYWGSISASGVVHDTGYPITVSMARYLDVTSASGRTVNITSDNQVLTTLALLGGDANDDNEIDIGDVAIIAGQYGNSGAGITIPGADINDDDVVDISDLVLACGNYGKQSKDAANNAYASWTP